MTPRPDTQLVIRALGPADAPALAALLQAQTGAYMRYFTPFPFDEAALATRLAGARQDIYMGLWWDEALAGFFMLRGWDEGYAVPAYGVTIAEAYRGGGLGRLTLELARALARRRGARQLMLKVHPDNGAAVGLYESFGFRQTGVDARNDNRIYHLDL